MSDTTEITKNAVEAANLFVQGSLVDLQRACEEFETKHGVDAAPVLFAVQYLVEQVSSSFALFRDLSVQQTKALQDCGEANQSMAAALRVITNGFGQD